MKKIILTTITIAINLAVFGQSSFPTDGSSVYINTTSAENGFKLDVNGLVAFGTKSSARIYQGTNDATHAFIQSRDLSVNQKLDFFASEYHFNIGNVGIGTTSPASNLEIQSPSNPVTLLSSGITSNLTGQVYSTIAFRSYKGSGAGQYAYNDALIQTVRDNLAYSGDNFTHDAGLAFYTNTSNRDGAPTEKFRVNSIGNVLIGTSTQTNTTYKLEVEGKMRAKEIVVNSTGADFVFDKKYKLHKLSDVKAYIDENHHLPEIPSADEMKVNGLELGDMNKRLLQKVEELTLYLIEKDKQQTEMQKKADKQEARIAALEKALSKLASK